MAGGEQNLLQDPAWRRRNTMWLVPTVLCCGFFTWASFLYVGVRAKRGAWLAAAAFYGIVFIVYFVIVGTAPEAADGTTDTSSLQSNIGTICVLGVWIGGFVHALIINSQWLAYLASPQDVANTPWFPTSSTINPATLEEPWRSFVNRALAWQREIATTVANTAPGPMRDRLQGVSDHVGTGIREVWQVAQGGQHLTRARARIDTQAIAQQLSQLRLQAPNPALTQAAQAFQAQLDAATRLEGEVSSTYNGLLLLNARLGEVSARVIELSARPHALTDAAAVDDDVESVVNQLVAIRQALTEMDEYPG